MISLNTCVQNTQTKHPIKRDKNNLIVLIIAACEDNNYLCCVYTRLFFFRLHYEAVCVEIARIIKTTI